MKIDSYFEHLRSTSAPDEWERITARNEESRVLRSRPRGIRRATAALAAAAALAAIALPLWYLLPLASPSDGGSTPAGAPSDSPVRPAVVAQGPRLISVSANPDSSGGGSGYRYRVVALSESEEEELILASSQTIADGAWAPDGSRMVVAVASKNNGEPNGLGILDPVSGHLTTIASSEDWWVSTPAWSPDGSRIAFALNTDGHGELFLVDVDGDGLQQLTRNSDGQDYDPTWSPDGATITFGRNSGGPLDLWQVDVQTGNTRQLTHFEDGEGGPSHPAYAPDGSVIAFLMDGTGASHFFEAGVFIVPSAGGASTRLRIDRPVSPWAGLSWDATGSSLIAASAGSSIQDLGATSTAVIAIDAATGWVEELPTSLAFDPRSSVSWNPTWPLETKSPS